MINHQVMERTIEARFWIGDRVYQVNQGESKEWGVVVQVSFSGDGGRFYRVAWRDGEGSHYEIELTSVWPGYDHEPD